MKYFKGYEKDTGKRVIIEIYDEPKDDFFEKEDVIGRVSFVEKSGFRKIFSMEDLLIIYSIREISEEEYKIFHRTQQLIEEFWESGLTGGFPSANAPKFAKLISLSVDEYFRKRYSGSVKEESNGKT